MESSVGRLPPTAQLRALESWRAAVLRGMLTVGAIAAPLIIVVSLALRTVPYPWPEVAILSVAAAAFPLLRFATGLSVMARARLTVACCYLAGTTALITFGFTSGSGIALVGTSILAVVFLGRRAGLVMTALSVVAFLVIGVLNARGILFTDRAGLDPTSMTNWARIGIAFSCLAALLTTAIDYVIRHVERTSQAASDALGDLRLAYERLALLHERLDAAKEEERRFISGELHDDLGQLLTVVKLRLQMGAPTAETLGLVDQAIDRIRKISRELRPALLDEVGLIPALRDHVLSQAALAGVPIHLELPDDDSPRLSPALEIACFRIVQESLTNALRHASATQIRVRVVRSAAAISLTISDDGRGFDPATLAALSAGHLGIVAMQERVRARGGSFAIASTPGAGTRVQVDLPVVG
ncbi:MAG TPA: sensor histidine kinase [Polyangia bacterium]|nr:sensor histidine kinase [Polyangia bacterium]